MVEQKNERGFYASVPRMVRTGYKAGDNKLTVTQKWIYVCLKDLCGDKGVCYRSLRTLAEETGVSVSMLSQSIPVLKSAGLVEASQKGQGTWCITIVDIWEQNRKLYPTKCSPYEHFDESQPDTVHYVNASVHVMNTDAPNCTPDEHSCSLREQKCSRNEPKDNVLRIPFSKDTKEEEKESSPSLNPSSSFDSQETEIVPTKEAIIPTNNGNVPQIDQLKQWITEFNVGKPQKAKIYIAKDKAKAATDLASLIPHVHSINDLKALYTHTKEHIYGENKTVFLGNLASNVEDWVKSLDAGSESQEKGIYEGMNREKALAFAQSLLSTFPAELLGIDQPFGKDYDIWTTCIQYAPDEWLPFGSEEHYRNPPQWERARIEEAVAYGQSLVRACS